MKGVIDDILVKSVGDNTWELLEPFEWYGIVVPKGFITDWASIPRLFWGIINPAGQIKAAALTHDYLYSKRGKLYAQPPRTRKQCDQIFLNIMVAVGMSWFKRTMAYTAVRAFGWIAWNKSR